MNMLLSSSPSSPGIVASPSSTEYRRFTDMTTRTSTWLYRYLLNLYAIIAWRYMMTIEKKMMMTIALLLLLLLLLLDHEAARS